MSARPSSSESLVRNNPRRCPGGGGNSAATSPGASGRARTCTPCETPENSSPLSTHTSPRRPPREDVPSIPGSVSSANPTIAWPVSSRIRGTGRTGRVSASAMDRPNSPEPAESESPTSPQFRAAGDGAVGTCATSNHSRLRRIKCVTTAASDASGPTTITRTGSLGRCGASCGAPRCGTSLPLAISSGVGLSSWGRTCFATSSRNARSRRPGRRGMSPTPQRNVKIRMRLH